MNAGARLSEESIRKHSKSFSLAARVLPPDVRTHAVALYAWCRRADDAVDLVSVDEQAPALDRLRTELEDVYNGAAITDPILSQFQLTVHERRLPRRYADDLLIGMEMDVRGQQYDSMDQLFEYCYHVAGCVGLMMCHVMGVNDDRALANATHLGMAMQLTNICRDVAEDWERERLYIPDELMADAGFPGLHTSLGQPFPEAARAPVARSISRLLDVAEDFYRSGDRGVPALSGRCGMAIRTARNVYSSIGGRIRASDCDPLAGRAYVPAGHKLILLFGAVLTSALEVPSRLARGGEGPAPPTTTLDFPDDVLPLASRPGVANHPHT